MDSKERKIHPDIVARAREVARQIDAQNQITNPFRFWTPSEQSIEADRLRESLKMIRDFDVKFVSIGILQMIAREALGGDNG